MNDNEIVSSITANVLYCLTYKHPVIDDVLKVKIKKKKWLVLLQVLLSLYKQHHSKINDLNRHELFGDKGE